MSWHDWISPPISSRLTSPQTYTSWVTWLIIAIVIIIIFWIIWGGGNHEFIGLKPLMPGVTPSEVMDRDTMIILGVADPISPRNEEPEEQLFEYPEIIDLSQLSQGSDSFTPFYKSSPANNQMICITPVLKEEEAEADVSIYLPSPDRPPTGRTPKFDDLDLGTREERKTAAESRGERVCRQFLERYYQKPFPRIRPDFLVNPTTGRNLELDGYNPELNIAFEYNGYQHYTYPNRFHQTEKAFAQQVRRDGYKDEACRLAGVYLIIIPYTVPAAHIPQFIKRRLPHKVHLLSDRI